MEEIICCVAVPIYIDFA